MRMFFKSLLEWNEHIIMSTVFVMFHWQMQIYNNAFQIVNIDLMSK